MMRKRKIQDMVTTIHRNKLSILWRCLIIFSSILKFYLHLFQNVPAVTLELRSECEIRSNDINGHAEDRAYVRSISDCIRAVLDLPEFR
eukprot:15367098-Ditylum_brightwellii.AAC.1